MKTLLFLAAFILAPLTARAEDAPVTPAATTATGQQQTPAPTTPAAPDTANAAARKEETEAKAGRVKAILAAAGGNKEILAKVATLTATITGLEAKVSTLEAENAALKAKLDTAEADNEAANDWIIGVTNGTIDPGKQAAPSAAAAATAEAAKTAIQTETSKAIQQVGVKTEVLGNPSTTKTETRATPQNEREARLAAVGAMWTSLGVTDPRNN